MSRVLVATLIALLVTTASASAQTAGDRPERLYGTAEYLLWWLKDSPTPSPLITTPEPDGSQKTLLGGGSLDTGEHHGGRFTLGYWFSNDRRWGVEASYFFLPETTTSKTAFSSGEPGSPRLFSPFFCLDCFDTPGPVVFPHSVPGQFGASTRETLTSSLRGGDLNVAHKVAVGSGWRVELLGGFRYFGLKEKYLFEVNSPLFPPVPNDVFNYSDSFDARNDFYGGQLGVRGEGRHGPWFVNGGVKVGLGVMRQRVDVGGSFVSSEGSPILGPDGELLGFTGQLQQFAGGVFAQPTNMGQHKRDVFAVIPEVNLNVGYDITSWMSVFIGYTFLYANNVVRPGKQIDPTINISQSALLGPGTELVGPAAPTFKFRSTDFWSMGLNVGVTFRY